MGKGGCFSQLAQTGVGTARSIAGFVCCILCTGPVLFIVGIVLLVSPNNRKANVDKYNSAVTLYNAPTGNGQAMKSSTFSVDGVALTPLAVPVGIGGDLQDVSRDGVSQKFSGLVTKFSSTSTIPASVSVNIEASYRPVGRPSSTTSFPGSFTTKKQMGYQYKCTSSRCTGVSVSSCPSGYRESYTGSSSCDRDKVCGTCYGSFFISKACFIVQLGGSSTNPSWSLVKSGCKYPFGSDAQEYASQPTNTITVEVYADTDPYVKLEEITQGTKNFGMTEAQQRSVGLALLVVGIIIMAMMCGVVVFSFQHQQTNEYRKQYWGTVTGNPYQPQPVMGQPMGTVGAPPGYGQPPPPGYGQPPPPAYGQPPPPGYGQPPPPGYGQPPPPAYGQPPPGYGQTPPPGYGQPPPAAYGQPMQ